MDPWDNTLYVLTLLTLVALSVGVLLLVWLDTPTRRERERDGS